MRYSQEDVLTIDCANYLRLQYKNVEFTHVANERKTKVVKTRNGYVSPEGSMLRKMGVRKGFSDLLILSMQGEFGALFIELKTQKIVGVLKNGKPRFERTYPTPEQREFLAAMHTRGYAVDVCWTVEEFKHTVDSYMKGEFQLSDYVSKLVEEHSHV